MHSESGWKSGVIFTSVLAAIFFIFVLFQPTKSVHSIEVSGEIIKTFAVAKNKESNKFIRVLLEDGNEVNSKVNKFYHGLVGKKVVLLKKTGATTEYVFQRIVE